MKTIVIINQSRDYSMEPWWCFGTMVTIHVIIGGMTVRKKDLNPALRRVGAIIKRHRIELIDIKPSRSDFIIDAVSSGLRADWISEKSLANIENGYNFPSLPTLYNLAIAARYRPRTCSRRSPGPFPSTIRRMITRKAREIRDRPGSRRARIVPGRDAAAWGIPKTEVSGTEDGHAAISTTLR